MEAAFSCNSGNEKYECTAAATLSYRGPVSPDAVHAFRRNRSSKGRRFRRNGQFCCSNTAHNTQEMTDGATEKTRLAFRSFANLLTLSSRGPLARLIPRPARTPDTNAECSGESENNRREAVHSSHYTSTTPKRILPWHVQLGRPPH